MLGLQILFKKIYGCSFIAGNHELWVKSDKEKNSFQKFHEIRRLCDRLGVKTRPGRVAVVNGQDVMVVPLFSWYTTPEEDSMDTLYVRHSSVREDVATMNLMWMDNHNCTWPTLYDSYPAQYFCELNEDVVASSYDIPVISFSHFMPRSDLILPSEKENAAVMRERASMGLEPSLPQNQGAPKFFNFSRFAGCKQLDVQIRQLGSVIHFHGHQHRNRDRVIDGVRYISHSLGYKRERDQGLLWGMSHWGGPRQIWPLPDSDTPSNGSLNTANNVVDNKEPEIS